MTTRKTKTPRPHGAKALTVHVSRLGEALKARGLHLKDGELIEIAAYAFGLRDGNTLAAAQKAGQLALAKPGVAERIRLASGERLIVLADPVEDSLFAIPHALLAGTAATTVVATPSGRLVDVTTVKADAESEEWQASTLDGVIEVPLHVAEIHHSHGCDTYSAVTERDLYRKIADYCRTNWNDIDVEGDPDPDEMSNEDVVSTYFSAIEDESEEYIETSVQETRVTPADLRALAEAGRPLPGPSAGAGHRTRRSGDPLTAWRAAVAAGATTLGYDVWCQGRTRTPAEVPAGSSRQFMIDPADLAVMASVTACRQATPAPDLPARSWALIGRDLAEASRRMATNAPFEHVIISLTDYEADAMREALKEYAAGVQSGAIVPAGDPASYGYSLERLIDLLDLDEPVIHLTNSCCENAYGDKALFDRLGLAAGEDDGAFDPLTADERRWILEDSVSHTRGEILMAHAGLYRGQKYLMPVLTLYHDPEDDATNQANADYLEHVVMPRIIPGVEALGGLVRFERDDEDDRHSLQVLLPVSATRGCAGYVDWSERVRAILEGVDVAKFLATAAPEPFAYVDSRTDTVIASGVGDLPAIGTTPVLTDPASRRIAGRVVGHRTAGERREVLYRVEMRDGIHPESGPLTMLPEELDPARYMTLAEVRALKPNDRVISLAEGFGDVESEDEMEGDGDFVERHYRAGDWLTVDRIDILPQPQGFAVTVVSENGVCNVFDEGDHNGRYPFLRPNA